MASEAGNIGPESKGAEAAVGFILDPVSPENIQHLLSHEVWENFMTMTNVSREEAGVIYKDLKSLRELMATEVRHMLSKDQLHREMFMKKFPWAKQELDEYITKLHGQADKMDKIHKDSIIHKIVTSSFGTLGGLIGIAGLLLAPETGGASLALTGAGLGISSAGMGIYTSIKEHIENKSAEAEARSLVADGIKKEKEVMDVLGDNTYQIESLIRKCSESLLNILLNAQGLKGSATLSRLVAKARDFLSRVGVSVGRGQAVERAVEDAAWSMTKGAKIFGAATSGLLLVMDVTDLIEECKELCEGAKTVSGEQLRQHAQKLAKRLEELTWIYKILQESPTS